VKIISAEFSVLAIIICFDYIMYKSSMKT